MSEAKKDDLHELIHALDPAERGHFSKFASRHAVKDGSNYEQLFQMLARMPEYDADAVTSELKRLGIATPLPAAKNHLKTIILQAMREYNSGRTTHSRLLKGLENLAFLYEKKQYDLLRKELKRLKKIAELHVEHHILFKIGDYESKLHRETAQRDIVEGMEEILSETQAQSKAFHNQLQFEHLRDKMFVIANKAGSDREKAVNALLTTELLASEGNALTLFSKIYYHQIHATAHMIKGQNQAAQRKYGAVVSLYENAPHLIEEFPSTYRRILGNYLQICSHTGDYEIWEQILAKVRSSPSNQLADKAEIFSIGHNAEILLRMETANWEGAASLIPAIQSGLAAYGHILRKSTVLAFQYNIATFYFLSEQYPDCNKWLREITEVPRTEQRMDIQRIAKVLGLLLIWLKREYDYLEYEHRSVTRYFENWGGGVLEQYALDFVQAMLHARDAASECTALEQFRDSIAGSEMKSNPSGLVLGAWVIGQLTRDSPRAIIVRLKEGEWNLRPHG